MAKAGVVASYVNLILIRKYAALLYSFVLLLAMAAAPATALDVEFVTRPVKREILALYDSRHEGSASESRIHRMAEMPLNWMGFKVTYADVNGTLPAPETLTGYRGVITWFVEPLQDPGKTLAWLDAVTSRGLRYACLAELAPPEPPSTEEAVGRVLSRLGLRPSDQFVSVTTKAKIATQDTAMVGFERPIDKALPEFRVMEAAAPTTKVHLSATVPGEETETTSVLIATGPGGGYAADAYTIYYDEVSNRVRWTLNPFAFFREAFGEERFPIPDVTTLSGRRMYFSHIDGDGWNNISEIEGYREAQASAADVILREVIAPYPDLPLSVGLIAGDALPKLGGMESAQVSARKIFALPQIEVATHTYTHPFAWKFFENYDRASEVAMIDKASRPPDSVMDRVRNFLYRIAGKAGLTSTGNTYIAGSADLPRGYLKEPFDLNKEIQGALKTSESFAPPGKAAAIYLWSGDAEPFEAAVAATRAAGVRNMNGGDTRFDNEFPSVFYVPPISRPVGRERQIYAANSNENTYTNYWHGPFFGQMMLKETLERTETPRRLKPFNLYYHMYSGEKPGSLAAIKMFVDMARNSPVIPVTASHYAAIADDFFAADIEQVDANTWSVAKRGNLQTVRFDAAEDIDVDLLRSNGVLGAKRLNGSLYVSLDSKVEPVTIFTTKRVTAASPRASLVESRWQLSDLRLDETCGFKVGGQGYGSSQMTWYVKPGQSFDVTAARSGTLLETISATADGGGVLFVDLKSQALDPLELEFKCHDR